MRRRRRALRGLHTVRREMRRGRLLLERRRPGPLDEHMEREHDGVLDAGSFGPLEHSGDEWLRGIRVPSLHGGCPLLLDGRHVRVHARDPLPVIGLLRARWSPSTG